MALEITSNTMYMYAWRLYRSWSKCTESIISGLNAILDRENLAERKLGTDRAKFTQNETNTTPAKRATELFEGKSITHCLASIELDHSSHVTSYWQCCCDSRRHASETDLYGNLHVVFFAVRGCQSTRKWSRYISMIWTTTMTNSTCRVTGASEISRDTRLVNTRPIIRVDYLHYSLYQIQNSPITCTMITY